MKFTKIVKEDINNVVTEFGVNDLVDKLKDKNVLITGASGMIGSYLTYTLIELNERYNANIKLKLVLRNEKKLDDYIKNHKNTDIIIHDVINPLKIEGDVHYVVHAASPASPKIMAEKPVETNLANTLGTAYTLELAREKKALGYVFISSREIYGEPLKGQELFTEDGMLGFLNPLIPRNGYAEGKKAAENLCASYKEEYGLNTKIVRLAHTYGPGMSINDGRVQADFLNNIIYKENIILKSDGSSIRTYTYISDAILAILLVLLKSTDIVYNVSDERSKTSIKELAETLVNINPEYKLKLVFEIDNNQKGCSNFKFGILSSEKIRNELNWKPKYNIKEGFTRTLEHLKDEIC